MTTTTDLSTRNRQPAGVSTGGQFAPETKPEPALPPLGVRPAPTWVQDKALGPALEIALPGSLRLGGYDAQVGPFVINRDGESFEAIVQDHTECEHTAEFVPEDGGIRMELHAGNDATEEVAWDIDNFTQDDTDCSTQRLAAVLANPEHQVDYRIREAVNIACPVVASAGDDARDLLDAHPDASVMVASLGASGLLSADLYDAQGQLVATGAGTGLDPQYAHGFGDLDQFEVPVPGVPAGAPAVEGVRAYDLELMSGRQL